MMVVTERKIDCLNYVKHLFIGFLIVFVATYLVTMYQVDGDFPTHILWAQRFNFTYLGEYLSKVVPYPLWHFLVKATKVAFTIEWEIASALVTASVNGGSFLAAAWVQKVLFSELDDTEGRTIFWIVCLMFVGPLYIPSFNLNYYLGQGTGNIWHNPSNIMVKLFAIIAFGILAKILKKKEMISKQEMIALSVVLVLSVLSKPAFLQGIIPGLGLYMIIRLCIDKSSLELKKYIAIILSFIPAVLIMLFQTYNTLFGTSRGTRMEHELVAGKMFVKIGEAVASNGKTVVSTSYQQGVGFSWGNVLSHWTPNIYISFLLAFAFPIFVFIFRYRSLLKDKVVQLVLCYELAAWLESVILYQKGPGQYHGNFLWASYLSMFMVWMIMLYHFLLSLKAFNSKKVKDYIYVFGGMTLFATHLLLGIWYVIDLVHG